MSIIIQTRRDTAANWRSVNPVLADGELGYESDTGKFKVGDGVLQWNNLDYVKQGEDPVWGIIQGTLSNQTDLQQALNGKQPVINDLDAIRSGASAGATALQASDVVDSTGSTATDKPLSANKGKALQDEINNVKSRGRFLSSWNCATGLPTTNPEESPYQYKAGDYYIVGNVGTGTKYRPNGSSYTEGVASTTVETAEVNKDDTYLYDGVSWILQSNTQKTVSFANVAGDPYDNTDLAAALNGKQATIDDLATIRSNATAGKSASDTIATYGDVVTHNVSEFATAAQGATADSALQGVQVNGTDLTPDTNNKVNIPKASNSTLGVVQTNGSYGIEISANGYIATIPAAEATLVAKLNGRNVVVANNLDIAVREGLGNNSLTWTDAYKESARNTIGAGAKTIIREWIG